MRPLSSFLSKHKIPSVNPEKIFTVISGHKSNFTLENRIFNIATLIAFTTGIIAIIWNQSVGLPISINILIVSFLLIFLILYYFSRFKRNYNSTIFVLTTLIGLSLQWFASEGSRGSIPMLYVISIVAFISISKARFHIVYLLLTLVDIIVLYALENLYFEELFFTYPSAEVREKDVFFGFITGLVLCYLIMSYFKSRYDIERQRLEDQSIELQELNATKDKLFSIISHDLRGPFNSILGFSQLMTDKENIPSEDQLRKYADRINTSADNAYRLLENLLSWARINQGSLPCEPKIILLEPVVQKSVHDLSEIFTAKDIVISVDIDESLHVYADQNMLQSVIRNLFSNAVKFTRPKGSVSVSARKINDQRVEITTSDSGIGMSKEIILELFQQNSQTGRQGTDGEPSFGLGLLLCKEFLTLMDGEIWVESEVNRGSRFIFTLPS